MTPDALTRGRAWFAARPHFHASMRDDVWRCGGIFCGWDATRRSWLAWSRTHNDQYAQTPAAALALVGYIDPVTP